MRIMRSITSSAGAVVLASAWLADGARAGVDPAAKVDLSTKASLLRHYSVPLTVVDQGSTFAQFDGSRGQLRSVSATLTGSARFALTTAGAAAAGKSYAFVIHGSPTVFDLNAWFEMKGSCAGTLTGAATQTIACPLAGGGALGSINLLVSKAFTGKAKMKLVLTPDSQTPPPGTGGAIANASGLPSTVEGSITYTYLPALQLPRPTL